MDKQDFIKTFICFSRQNYYEANRGLERDITDRITIENSAVDGCGIEYEFSMEWHLLSNKPTPRVAVFHDSFRAFEEHKVLFKELVKLHEKDFTPDEFSRLLIKLGYKDLSDKKLV